MSALEVQISGTQGDFSLDAAFSIPAKGVTALFGPSGCGKTSVLRCIAGLNTTTKGRISLNDRVWLDDRTAIPTHRRPIGYVFQEASLFAHLSVRDNLLFGQKRSGGPSGLAFGDVVDLLGLGGLVDRAPARLSGGERQRVAIGRALLSKPEILLMDEPLAALDRDSKNDIIPYLETLHETLSIPILYVSHDIAEVERLADHMVLMDKGTVRAVGPLAELLANPALPFARTPGASAVFEGEITGFDPQYGLTTLATGPSTMIVPNQIGPIGAKRRLRILASDVSLCRDHAPSGLSILNALDARILSSAPLTQYQVNVFLRLGSDGSGPLLLARITRKSWDSLGLKDGTPVIALIKSVALAGAL